MLQLIRPLAIIDLETTGINLGSDRIVEIAIVKIMQDGKKTVKRKLINPEMQIPQGSTDIHGITNEMIRDAPAFRQVANEHFVKTPIARKYGMSSLDWFFSQWVSQSNLPSYRLEYQLQNEPDGKVLLTGTVTQEGAPNDWFMVLPLALTFGGKKPAFTTVAADGPKAPFSIKLPARPTKVDLDPDRWVLSENTSTK